MKPTQLLTDDDAVSPVIGVILMVAVTVIMAAIVGAFVLSISGDVAVVPQNQWDTSTQVDDGGNVTQVEFRHRAGERVNVDRLEVQIPTDREPIDGNETDGQVRVGDRIVVEMDESGTLGRPGDDVLLLWTSEDGSESAILAEHTFTGDYWDTIDSAETE